MNIFLSSAAALFPALLWLGIFLAKDTQNPEPKNMIVRAFFFGALSALPIALLVVFFPESVSQFFGLFGLLTALLLRALIEEYLKHFAAVRLGKSLNIAFDQIVDGIVYSVSAALGFAFLENAFYFFTLGENIGFFTPTFASAFAGRAILTTLGHALFSGIFGLFWGHAFLSQSIAPRHSYSVLSFFRGFFRTISFHILRRHILPRRASLRGHEAFEVVAEGFLAASLVHAFFNLCLEFPSTRILLAPLIVFLFWFLSSAFHRQNLTKILHPIIKNDKISAENARRK